MATENSSEIIYENPDIHAEVRNFYMSRDTSQPFVQYEMDVLASMAPKVTNLELVNSVGQVDEKAIETVFFYSKLIRNFIEDDKGIVNANRQIMLDAISVYAIIFKNISFAESLLSNKRYNVAGASLSAQTWTVLNDIPASAMYPEFKNLSVFMRDPVFLKFVTGKLSQIRNLNK
jgi:hypothetical protein